MPATRDKEKPARVTAAFLKMKKFDIAALERAFEGRQEESAGAPTDTTTRFTWPGSASSS